MAICDLIIAIPVQGLIKQFNQKILYSCMTNYDKLLNRQTTKASDPANKDLLYIQNRQEHQKDTMSSWEILESP